MSWGDADLGGNAGHVQDQLMSNVLRRSDPEAVKSGLQIVY